MYFVRVSGMEMANVFSTTTFKKLGFKVPKHCQLLELEKIMFQQSMLLIWLDLCAELSLKTQSSILTFLQLIRLRNQRKRESSNQSQKEWAQVKSKTSKQQQ